MGNLVSLSSSCIMCKENQKKLCQDFAKSFPSLWEKVLEAAKRKAEHYQLPVLVSFVTPDIRTGLTMEIRCKNYQFRSDANFTILEAVQQTLMDNDMTVEHVTILVR